MTTLQAGSPYWQGGLWLLLVGIGSGMFNSPNTAAMMGTVPVERRGIAAGARTMLQNTGAVISIAFVLAIVTAAMPKEVLFAIFSGLASGLSAAQLDPFIHNMHTALWVLAATSVLGAGVSLLRPQPRRRRRGAVARRPRRSRRRSPERCDAVAVSEELRIGEVAKLAGHDPADDPLLRGDRPAAGAGGRQPGAHRTYAEADVERLTELLRLKDLLGLSLEELKELVEAEDARAALRREWESGVDDPVRRRQILDQSLDLHRPPARPGPPQPRRDQEAGRRAGDQAQACKDALRELESETAKG